MGKGRFVQDHGSLLENPTVTGEEELFVPERDDTSGHMEVEVLFFSCLQNSLGAT